MLKSHKKRFFRKFHKILFYNYRMNLFYRTLKLKKSFFFKSNFKIIKKTNYCFLSQLPNTTRIILYFHFHKLKLINFINYFSIYILGFLENFLKKKIFLKLIKIQIKNKLCKFFINFLTKKYFYVKIFLNLKFQLKELFNILIYAFTSKNLKILKD
jgi:hypothetical protein